MQSSRKLNRSITEKLSSVRYNVLIVTIFIVVFLCRSMVEPSPEGGKGLSQHLLFAFIHANIFHLMANVICFMQIRNPQRYIAQAFCISLLCSFLPQIQPIFSHEGFSADSIIGASGMIFAIVGMKYEEVSTFKKMVYATAPFLIISAFLPNVAWTFHIQCLIIGFLFSHLKNRIA